jgi:hypothetical protein
MLVRCAQCGAEYQTREMDHGLVAIEAAHVIAPDPDCPAPVYGIGLATKIVCPVFACRGDLEPVNA